jgi:hypothetical protein
MAHSLNQIAKDLRRFTKGVLAGQQGIRQALHYRNMSLFTLLTGSQPSTYWQASSYKMLISIQVQRSGS